MVVALVVIASCGDGAGDGGGVPPGCCVKGWPASRRPSSWSSSCSR